MKSLDQGHMVSHWYCQGPPAFAVCPPHTACNYLEIGDSAYWVLPTLLPPDLVCPLKSRCPQSPLTHVPFLAAVSEEQCLYQISIDELYGGLQRPSEDEKKK